MEKKVIRVLVIILIIALIVVTLSINRSCRLKEKASFWSGHYEAQIEVNKDLAKENREGKKTYENRINELNGMIDSANTVNAELEMRMATADRRTETLAETEVELRARELDLDTARELIANLTASRNEWIKKLNLSQEQLDVAEDINFALSEKYEASVNRIVFLEGVILNKDNLIFSLNKNWKTAEKRRRQSKTWGTVKTLGIVALSAYAGYKTLKK